MSNTIQTANHEDALAEKETEIMLLRRALKHAMAHVINLRYGRMTPETEARRYAKLLREATDAMKWTERQ